MHLNNVFRALAHVYSQILTHLHCYKYISFINIICKKNQTHTSNMTHNIILRCIFNAFCFF
jgi:hypothetical protein